MALKEQAVLFREDLSRKLRRVRKAAL